MTVPEQLNSFVTAIDHVGLAVADPMPRSTLRPRLRHGQGARRSQ